MTKCEICEGKGYEQLQSCYDEIHSRIECSYCMGDGIEIKDVCEEQKLHDPEYITQGQIDKQNKQLKILSAATKEAMNELEAKRTKDTNYIKEFFEWANLVRKKLSKHLN